MTRPTLLRYRETVKKKVRQTDHLKAPLSPGDIRRFRQTVYRHYIKHGRELPWRLTDDPYRILLSEVMLQQTQVSRVTGKYEAFLSRFPDFQALASAPLSDILSLWQGMGYNRRALALKAIAWKVVTEHAGVLPTSPEVLSRLPGLGTATASAICAFAFNAPVVFIETNIRSVFIHFFFSDKEQVTDREIIPLVAATLDRRNPRIWYYALMDYGAMLKKAGAVANDQSTSFRRAPPFKGSDRQVRGAIVKALVGHPRQSAEEVAGATGHDPVRVAGNLRRLVSEGLVAEAEGLYSLP